MSSSKWGGLDNNFVLRNVCPNYRDVNAAVLKRTRVRHLLIKKCFAENHSRLSRGGYAISVKHAGIASCLTQPANGPALLCFISAVKPRTLCAHHCPLSC